MMEQLIRRSLISLHGFLVQGTWHGREREVVSLYAFGHLLPEMTANGMDPTQIGIEVAVPQVPRENHRRKDPDVCKDLVIWPEPSMTTWKSESEKGRFPSAILEWKTRNNTLPRSSPDSLDRAFHENIDWLQQFANMAPEGWTGYAVSVDLALETPWMRVAKVTHLEVTMDWLTLGSESGTSK